MSVKNILKNATKRGIPAAIGGAAGAAVDAAATKYAGDYIPDWLQPFVPGIVGIALMGGKETYAYAGAGMVGYSVGKAAEGKIGEMISGEVLADEDFNELVDEEEPSATY